MIKNNKGFTIPELLIVIALIGILLILVMVNFNRGNRSTDLRQAGNKLMQDLRQTQNYSISGKSVKYCDDSSDTHRYNPCESDAWCGTGTCKLSVPGGGFGVVIQSTEYYSIFADTYYVDDFDPENPVYYNYFNNDLPAEQVDYEIQHIDYTLDGIHLRQYKFGDSQAVVPDINNRIDIVFDVPEGNIKFYENMVEKINSSNLPENNLQIIISSDYVNDSCRKITINRISGQISESQSVCNL